MKKNVVTILCILFFGSAFSQVDVDNFVKTIEKLRREKKLIIKAYPDKTFVGSLTGYYQDDSLVLINTLTDGEMSGRESLYYFKNGNLVKLYIIKAEFDSSDVWRDYFAKHMAIENCEVCHSKPNCTTAVVTFQSDTTFEGTHRGKQRTISTKEREEIVHQIPKTIRELKILLKEL